MKYLFLVLSIMITTICNADVRRLCKVQYKTEDGWSKEYTLEVQFITGGELNKKTNSYNYSAYKNYCLIWFGEGKVAIIEISSYLSYVGDEFDHEDFISAFSYRNEINGDQSNSDSPREWTIKAKEYGRFVDPREDQ